MSRLSYYACLTDLKGRVANVQCDELKTVLSSFGYEVVQRASGKHHTYDHPEMDWIGANFDCGHGRNPQVLPNYVRKVIKVLTEHEDDLKEIDKRDENGWF